MQQKIVEKIDVCSREREKHTIRAYTNHGLLYQNTLIFGMVDYNIPYTYA